MGFSIVGEKRSGSAAAVLISEVREPLML